jgi:hypothetical protein
MAIDDPWQAALSVEDIAALLEGLAARWWVAGGWAIDLFLGTTTRQHQDVDVAVLRPDQLAAQAHLDGWDLRVAHNGRLTPWTRGRPLDPHQHGIWARPTPASPWQLELLVDDVDGDQWVYRRNPAVRLPLDALGRSTPGGIPYLRPEVILLYKAKQPRAADEQDARAVIPRLSSTQRAWLAEAIAQDMPNHHWLLLLADQEPA